MDVVDEAAYPKYLFVNADEYGLFARKRKFLQLVVCYQVRCRCASPRPAGPSLRARACTGYARVVGSRRASDLRAVLSTQWNSHAHREAELGEASQLKPRYLFLYAQRPAIADFVRSRPRADTTTPCLS